LWVQIRPGLSKFLCSLTIQRRAGRTVRHLSAKEGRSQEANGFDSGTLRHAEGTAEWPATGPENQGIVMSDGRSIRPPSAEFAQVREPGRNGQAVTRSPLVWDAEVQILPCAPECQRVRIGIAACLRNRRLRVRISPLVPDNVSSQVVKYVVLSFGWLSLPASMSRKTQLQASAKSRYRSSATKQTRPSAVG
jgi:hypothetical protein